MGKKSSIMKASFFSYTSVLYTNADDEITPLPHTKTTSITIESPTTENANPTPIPVILPESVRSAAAVKIQSAYRSHMVRKLVVEITAVNSEAGRYEELIHRQETVDAVRSDDRERLRVSEGLMSLLLRLDGVRGIDPAVRELRRSVSRRIVALQEVVDAVAEAKLERARNPDGQAPGRMEMFGLTHTCRDGQPVDRASEDAFRRLNERVSQQPESSERSCARDDIFTKVMGEDIHGRVRTFGMGVSPSDIYGPRVPVAEAREMANAERAQRIAAEQRMVAVEERMDWMEACMNQMMTCFQMFT